MRFDSLSEFIEMQTIKYMTPPCKICGKRHMSENNSDWVYHQDVGTVCIHHHGVEKWYKELIEKVNKESAEALEIRRSKLIKK